MSTLLKTPARSWGITLLCLWLVLRGGLALLDAGDVVVANLLHGLAIAAGVLLYLDR
jgi:hypothetical protein